MLHRTDIREQLVGVDRTSQERNGFILTWYRSTPPIDDLVARLQEQEIPEVDVDRDEMDRVRLSIRNLQFVADQAELLPGERGRLDDIAELLISVPASEILVTGHTADVGTEESQMILSIERAKKMVDELVARGVSPGRLRYEGKGGTEPIGDNSTEEGRAANRRVELRLLSE